MQRYLVVLLAVALIALPAAGQVCSPTVLDSVSLPGTPTQPALYGSTAWVAAGNAGLVPIDAADSGNLSAGTAVNTPGEARDVVADFFSGVVMVADGSAGVSAFTASGTSLSLIGSTSLGQPATSIAGSGTSYVIGSSGGTLFTIGLSGSGPVVEGSITLGSPILDVVTVAQQAYVALGTGGLAIVSLTSRANPSVSATLSLGGAVRSLALRAQHLYAGVDGRGLVALTIQGAVITEAGTLNTAATPSALLAAGNRVYATIPGHGILVVDTSLGTPLQLGELALPGAAGLEIAGEVLYVGVETGGFAAVDIAACATGGVSATMRYIPAAAHAEGAESTYWVTDVAVVNLSAGTATVNLAYLVKDQPNPAPANVSYVLQSGQQLLLEDLLHEVFGFNAANGALRVIVSHPNVRVTSRTYNAAGASGTYGQFIPALDDDAILGSGVVGALPQLAENAAFRTNVGLLNVAAADTEVTVDLYRYTGVFLGSHTIVLRPYEMRQVNQILSGAGTVASGYAVVRVTGAEGGVLAYASVVDNESGDPIYVPAQRLVPGTPFGN